MGWNPADEAEKAKQRVEKAARQAAADAAEARNRVVDHVDEATRSALAGAGAAAAAAVTAVGERVSQVLRDGAATVADAEAVLAEALRLPNPTAELQALIAAGLQAIDEARKWLPPGWPLPLNPVPPVFNPVDLIPNEAWPFIESMGPVDEYIDSMEPALRQWGIVGPGKAVSNDDWKRWRRETTLVGNVALYVLAA